VASGAILDFGFNNQVLRLGLPPCSAKSNISPMLPTASLERHASQDSSSTLLEEAVRRLVVGINPLRIYLFGSRARQDAGPDSDYDLFTVVSKSDAPAHSRSQQARHYLRGLNASFDIIVLTSEEWTRQLRSGVSLANAVVKEGKLIHESRA
jgi:predicted nucleotidyltransferase